MCLLCDPEVQPDICLIQYEQSLPGWGKKKVLPNSLPAPAGKTSGDIISP